MYSSRRPALHSIDLGIALHNLCPGSWFELGYLRFTQYGETDMKRPMNFGACSLDVRQINVVALNSANALDPKYTSRYSQWIIMVQPSPAWPSQQNANIPTGRVSDKYHPLFHHPTVLPPPLHGSRGARPCFPPTKPTRRTLLLRGERSLGVIWLSP